MKIKAFILQYIDKKPAWDAHIYQVKRCGQVVGWCHVATKRFQHLKHLLKCKEGSDIPLLKVWFGSEHRPYFLTFDAEEYAAAKLLGDSPLLKNFTFYPVPKDSRT